MSLPTRTNLVPAMATHAKKLCPIGRLVRSLDVEDASALETVLRHPRVPHSEILGKLREHGHKAAERTLIRHRKGECRCE